MYYLFLLLLNWKVLVNIYILHLRLATILVYRWLRGFPMYKVEEWAVNWSLNLRDFSVLICVLLPILKQINTKKDAELETEAMVKDSIRFINFWCYIINSDLNLNLLFVCNWYMLLKKSTSFSPFCLLLLRCLVLSCLDNITGILAVAYYRMSHFICSSWT